MPQQYTLIKIQILEPFTQTLKPLEGQKVFLVAATLRPETMYGQTNCFILPEGEYGVYKMRSGDIFICSERSAKNMAYQEMMPVQGKYEAIVKIKGAELLGAALKAPLTKYEKVYVLPMLTISMNKGTGIVTSCPSDAPDDYAALRDLQKKKEFREKFGIKDECVMGFEPIPIIKTPTFGAMAAVKLCEDMKIASQNDTAKLKEAKDTAYLKGFTEGIMTIGICDGEKVSEAKNKVRKYMIDNGMAVDYWEPSDVVISRSGDECVDALCDQWCENYGEKEWKERVLSHIHSKNFTCYNDGTFKGFTDTLDWLKEWACSRIFGLGSRIPWDPQFLIESLSDSTIYMAYYTVSHLLQGGVVDGSKPGPLNIKAEDMTDAEWNYVFLHKPYPQGSKVEESKLAAMRHEFEFWYPLDSRCSAKDLIKNHLTMSLYNHAAIWDEQGTAMMPRSIFCNGYMCVDGIKMSKQEGNFYTVREILDMFGSDATRFALAGAGDLLDDGNVEIMAIDNAILKLFTLQEWIEKQMLSLPAGPLPVEKPESLDLFDKIFLNDMARLIEETKSAYDNMKFRDVIKYGFFEFQGVKDDYLVFKKMGKPSWRALLNYVEWQLIIICPIIPHLADYCWRTYYLPKMKEIGEATNKPETVVKAAFPISSIKFDKVMGRISSYLRDVKRAMRLAADKAILGANKKQKQKAPQPEQAAPKPGEAAPEQKKEEAKGKKKQKGGKQEQKKEEKKIEEQKPEAPKPEDTKPEEKKKEEKAPAEKKPKQPKQKAPAKKEEEKGKEEKKEKKPKKEKGKKEDKPAIILNKCIIFVAKQYTEQQRKVLETLNKMGLNEKNEIVGDVVANLRTVFDGAALGTAMKFASFCTERAAEVGKEAFEIAMPFDEKDLLSGNIPFLGLDMPVKSVEIFEVMEPCPYEKFKTSKMKATPGHPEICYEA